MLLPKQVSGWLKMLLVVACGCCRDVDQSLSFLILFRFHSGIATSVALAMCPPAVAVPLAYGAMEVVVLALYGAWARRAGWTMENNADGSIMDKPVEYALVGMSMVGLEMEEEDSHKDDSSMGDEEESGDALLPSQLSLITTQAKELAYERQETEETLDSSLA